MENFAINMAEAKSGGEKGKKILSYVAKRSRRAQEKVLSEPTFVFVMGVYDTTMATLYV